MLDKKILEAIKKKKIFIGFYMLCRYLNGKGYKRYGCNAGYKKPFTNGKDRLNPCPILCPNTDIYYSRVYYWSKKLEKQNEIFIKKIHFYDSKNPDSNNSSKLNDIFCLICESEVVFNNYMKKHTLKSYIEV